MTHSMLGVFAHPDDELFAGAMLAQRARAGDSVEIVVATRGEAGRSWIDSPLPLGQLRTAELEASCAALGIAPPTFLDLLDGTLEANAAELERRLAAIVAGRPPSVLVTTGLDGVYGHPDHIAVTRAVEAVAPREVLYAAFPQGLFDPLRESLRKLPNLSLADVPLGTDRDHVMLEVPVEPVRLEKQRAIACHESQLRGGEFLMPGLIEHLSDVEWYTAREQ